MISFHVQIQKAYGKTSFFHLLLFVKSKTMDLMGGVQNRQEGVIRTAEDTVSSPNHLLPECF